jgi:hypothetical protein
LSAPDQPLGVLGDVIAYHFNPEEQGRGSLHYHGMVWLGHKPDTETFCELLRTPEFQQRVLHYLQGAIKQEEPVFWPKDELKVEVPLAPGQRIESMMCKICSHKHKVLAGEGAESTAASRSADKHPSCMRIADPTADGFDRELLADAQELAPLVRTGCLWLLSWFSDWNSLCICLRCQVCAHMKNHHESCRKASDKEKLQKLRRKSKAKEREEEIDCRHGFPRPLVETAHFAGDGCIQLRRLSHWINNFNPYFLAALRCNHDIKHLWGTDTNIMTVVVYCTNYMTKVQRRLLSTVMLVQVRFQQAARITSCFSAAKLCF